MRYPLEPLVDHRPAKKTWLEDRDNVGGRGGNVSQFIPRLQAFKLRGSLNKFLDFFRMATFIDRTHTKL